MMEKQRSNYDKRTLQYLSGRIPFRIWFFSSIIGAIVIIVDNLVRHEAVLQGFFSVLFLNLVITIPLFLAQAHFVGKALKLQPNKVGVVMFIVLILGWLVTGLFIFYGLHSVYDGHVNSGLILMLINFCSVAFSWVMFSYWTTIRKLQKI